MKKIKSKLNSNDGVTILIALVGFMVAAMVSIVIVTAAITSAKRVANDKKTNQAHLTLESAAQIVRDAMEGTTETVSGDPTEETTYQFMAYKADGTIDTDTASVTGTFGDEMKSAVEYVNKNFTGTSPDTSFEVSVKDQDAMETVKVSFTMDENYNIVFTFRVNVADGSEACVHLDMTAGAVSRDEASGNYVIRWNAGSNIIYS